MFTPHKGLQGWSLTPKSGSLRSGTGSGQNPVGEKGKGVGLTPSSAENGGPAMTGSAETASGHDGLGEKLSQMEQELFEYQYHMGILLIEKKEWTSKYEELREGLAEAMDALKREQAAHSIAMSDVEKREENLRKALGVEKQCVVDLEKALREIRAENAEIKYNADSKLAEANALVTSIEEKSLELEAKLHSADAKLAEVSRKTSEISRKSQDLEAQESEVRRNRLSFMEEQKAHESSLSRQREDLREWEKKLQEGEERLAKGQIILNQREERSNENDRVIKQKQKELEVSQKKIDESSADLKSKEDDISSRIANLTVKEKEYDALRTDLEMKEEALSLLEDKLNTREKVELQKLTDEHNVILEMKKREFEIEIEEKRKEVDVELKNKVVDVEKKEAEINHKEEKLVKREKALENRLEKFREKEKDYEAKSKALKEREKSVKSEEKSLEKEREEVLADKEELLGLTAEVEKIKAANEAQLQTIMDESDRLKVTEEERSDFQRLQSELKQEIETYRRQKELVLKEAEDLRQQKEVFERDWEVIDEKRAELEKEIARLSEQKEEFENLKGIEEERLMNERAAALENIRREQEDLKLVQESFKAQMEQEKSLLAEKVESERNLMLHDYESRKRELEAEMQSQLEEMEKPIREKEKAFEDERKRELDNISYLREVARREMEELKSERSKIEREKVEAEANKQHLETQRVEIQKDIDGLFELSTKLRDQREQFVKERERFLLFVEKLKGSNNCGETISEFVLSDLQPLAEIENAEVPPVPKLSEYATKDLKGKGQSKDPSPIADVKSPISWLRKCTSKLFKISPGKNFEFTAVRNLAEEEPFSGSQNPEDPTDDKVTSEIEAEHSFAAASESFDVQIVQSNTSIRDTEGGHDQLEDDASNIKSKRPEPEVQPRKRGKAKIIRSRSVRAVVEDAKKILGDDFQVSEEGGGYQNGNAEVDDSENAATRRTRKRGRASKSQATVSEQQGGESEGPSDSVAGAAQPKRRRGKAPVSKHQAHESDQQTQVSEQQAGAEIRYNLRRPKSQVTAVPARASRGRKNKEQTEVVANKVASTSSVGLTSENDESTFRLVRCTTVATTEEVTMNMEEVTKNMVENRAALSEEVDGDGDGDENQGDSPAPDYTSSVEEDEEDEEEDEESQHPGEASIGKKIGKKLWTFLTT